MNITIRIVGAEKIILLTPECHDEELEIEELGRVGDELKGTIKHDAGYAYPHIELRKEIL